MKSKVIRLTKHSVIRYLFIGGGVYLFEVFVILLCINKVGLNPVQATAISFILGTALSFGLHKIITFGDKRTHRHVVASQVVLTGLLIVFNFCFTLLMTQLLAELMSPVLIRTISLIITTIWNFYIYKTRIFNKESDFNFTEDITTFLRSNVRILSLISGSVFVSLWTMLRFFVKNSNFDLVGQQLLTQQWIAETSSNGAIIGPTNYILKMMFVYLPFELLPGSPRLKLIVMTLFINIVTFVAVIMILEKIWKIFYGKTHNGFYVSAVWLATLSGSVYWIQFSNSRNLEVVGGLLLVLIILWAQKQPTTKHFVLIFLLSALLFFADPLQLYMTAVPVTAYYILSQLYTKKLTLFKSIVKLGTALSLGFCFSLLIKVVMQNLLGVEFIVVADQTLKNSFLTTLISGVVPAVSQATRLYSGGYELGRFIQAVNLLFVAAVIAYGTWGAWKKKISRRLYLLIAVFLTVNTLVYVISGQSLQEGTSRYLIMTVPFVILLVAAVTACRTRLRKLVVYTSISVVLMNAFALTYAVYLNRDTSFTKDAHINSAIYYMNDGKFSYGFASMDTALPGSYFSGGQTNLLPLTCLPNLRVEPVYLFFYRSYYQNTLNSSVDLVPIILDGDSIANHPSICNQKDVEIQYGIPKRLESLSDGSRVLLYDSKQLIPKLMRNQ